MKRDKAKKAVDNYKKVITKVEEAVSILETIDNYLPYGFSKYKKREVISEVTKRAWWYAIDAFKARERLSHQRYYELERLIEDKAPPLTIKRVMRLHLTRKEQEENLKEIVYFVGRWLRPYFRPGEPDDGWKLEKKAIVNLIDTTYGGGFEIRYHYRDYIEELEKCFLYLDGQKPNEFTISKIINEAGAEHKKQASTPYFDFKWYKNGSLHIFFNRMDLVEKFNDIFQQVRKEREENDHS